MPSLAEPVTHFEGTIENPTPAASDVTEWADWGSTACNSMLVARPAINDYFDFEVVASDVQIISQQDLTIGPISALWDGSRF